MTTSEAICRAIEALQYRRDQLDRDCELEPHNPISKLMREGACNDRDAIIVLNKSLGSGLIRDHDHSCHCGTATTTPHETGTCGCVRTMVQAPNPAGIHEWLKCPMWDVGDRDGQPITDTTLKEQRGYHEHPCGCWSCHESTNSIDE